MSDLITGDLEAELKEYGVPDRSVQYLRGQVSPQHIEYLDLIEPRGDHAIMPDSVVESQGQPLLFVVNESHLAQPPQETEYQRLRHVLACRGQRAYLARLRAGELSVVPVKLTDQKLDWKIYRAGTDEALSFFPRLALGHYDGKGDTARRDYVFEQMFKLLNQAAHELVKSHGLDSSDVLSLVGRALFFRFLRDRRIITESDVQSIAPAALNLDACFETPTNAAATCHWLDETFNGDFLPLTGTGDTDFFSSIERQSKGKVFEHLTAIVRAYEAVGRGNYQLHLWRVFDFAHIPVGLLSQVYEKFAWEWDPHAGSTSVHYTPRHIAATLVEEVFDKLPNAYKCRTLDPACGAGVFLVLAFRRLYRERWNATGVRPDTRAIRGILEHQITGFDISESALRMAALSLYLTAIELDPDPVPPHKLKFRDLRGKVLFNFRSSSEPEAGPVIGSLSPELNERHDGQYDVVVSNPPWTSLEEKYKVLAEQLDETSKEIIERRGGYELARQYHNPDNAPDLPFLWKAIEWCKPNGRIAMALPARILLKQEPIPLTARNALFQLLEINGIINGSNLADTPVWPKISQPFLLLFASNRTPSEGHILHFVTPQFDANLNRRGEMWIDSKSGISVDVEATCHEPWLWKALSVGTVLDIEVVRKVKAAYSRRIGDYWETDLGLSSSNGYKVAESEAKRQDARSLQTLPDLNSEAASGFLVHLSGLDLFSRDSLARTRLSKENDDELRVYRGPLVLIKQSPGMNRWKGRALLSIGDVAYNESFYGYSGAGHPNRVLLTRYFHLFAHCDIWMYFALLTSPKFGAERRKFYKSDFDRCPIVPLESLAPVQQETIMRLSERLLSEDMSVFDEIDAFFAELYGLDALDMEVIRDTLAVGMPYDEARQLACSPLNPKQQETFRQRLETLLHPFFKVLGKELSIVFWQPHTGQRLTAFTSHPPATTPFAVVLISASGQEIDMPDEALWHEVVQLANENGSTRIFLQVEGVLLVAMLNQYRYWTPTRARLCAAEIARQYMGIFEA